ncbi:MAG: radical SAM protein [archaeon]
MILKYGFRIFPKLIGYKLALYGLIKPPYPILFNFSVTNKCQSKCTMCNIWKLYKNYPKKEREELKIDEIEKIFKTMKPVFLLNICGGEPFLRDDLDDICMLASKYIKPAVIHIPTNCLAPEKIRDTTTNILKKIPKNTQLTIKMSLDGIGSKHDKIRGIKGNFKKLIQTYNYLKDIREEYSNLYVDAGVTVSLNNIKDLKEITEYVEKNFDLDNFLHEIADTRAELFNADVSENKLKKDYNNVMEDLHVTPKGKQYQEVVDLLINDVRRKIKTRRKLSKITQALRIVYYKRAAKVMSKEKRVVPCYAGISNAHLNPWGGLWICNVQAFRKKIGNLKDYDYDFNKIWYSKKAYEIRKFVKSNQCYCPLVGQSFLDTVLNPKELFKVFYYYFFG